MTSRFGDGRRRRTHDLRLEERVNERGPIARELHDSLLQGFQGLIFLLQAVRDLLPGQPERALAQLDAARDRADAAIIEGRDAVHDLGSSPQVDTDLIQSPTIHPHMLRYACGFALAHS